MLWVDERDWCSQFGVIIMRSVQYVGVMQFYKFHGSVHVTNTWTQKEAALGSAKGSKCGSSLCTFLDAHKKKSIGKN